MDAADPTDLETFVASAGRIVAYLNARTPFTDWSVSRVAGEEQVHLHVAGGTILHTGDRVPWDETFCRRMLAGASSVVPDACLDPDYADLPMAGAVRGYAGVPIVDGDGSLFGTLCGVSGAPLQSRERIDGELLDVFSGLLSAQLALVHSSATHRNSALVAEALASTDRLTGLMNRRGWDLVVAEAQERVDSLGDRAGVLMIDLDGLKAVNDSRGHQAGDALITTAATALRTAALPGHRVARYGGDEFAVYVEDAVAADLPALVSRYADALAAAGVEASIGAAPVVLGAPGTAIELALEEADASMYARKVSRRP
ncbi:GGDEF domain-containing protein [Nocardioides sp. CER19]|uniref:GGDEF domain-containing protein n=1 Tax=Nocardioides sp. CER19 TaxID=3038538 RepID=UPI002446B151|nr:GGDEF domain-containing protein [Nocardioides sp. CER19]MDH2416631.1 GGDEF domain-containing protein [Nocardioides sp. CER19]